MWGTASAASAVFTVTRTSSEPARERLHLLHGALDVSRIGVRHRLHDDRCRPPTLMGPMDTWMDLRRWMDDMVPAGEALPGAAHFTWYDLATPYCPERVRPPPERGREAPPGNAQATTADRGFGREVDAAGAHPPKGSGAAGARSLRSPDRGRQGHGMPMPLVIGPE